MKFRSQVDLRSFLNRTLKPQIPHFWSKKRWAHSFMSNSYFVSVGENGWFEAITGWREHNVGVRCWNEYKLSKSWKKVTIQYLNAFIIFKIYSITFNFNIFPPKPQQHTYTWFLIHTSYQCVHFLYIHTCVKV